METRPVDAPDPIQYTVASLTEVLENNHDLVGFVASAAKGSSIQRLPIRRNYGYGKRFDSERGGNLGL